jgi:trehalose 6-phosphate synthase
LEFNQRQNQWSGKPGCGGLVSAMNPILEQRGGIWVGWPGMIAEEARGHEQRLGELLAGIGRQAGYTLEPVMLSTQQVHDYYEGFANSVLWPLFHGFPNRCDFNPRYWNSYLEVNRKFAATLAETLTDGQPIWVHDYHLICVAEMLRGIKSPGHVGYFLHIPFPALENFVKLPWRAELMRALLAYDLLGFQSARDERNFLECVERLVPGASISRVGSTTSVAVGGDQVTVGVFPISIDFEDFDRRARTEEVTKRVKLMRTEIGPYKMLLGIDRLDYTKGLIERFHAFEELLSRHPDLCEEVVLFQLVMPSRENVPEYRALKREIDRIVGRINGRFSTSGWQPIHYLYNTVDIHELTALYRFAAAAVVTPLCDGMNLVAKEFCASQVEPSGVLILSEFAGAADEFHQDALLVNPYDTVGCAEVLYRAVTMSPGERRERMERLRERIQTHNVFGWANQFVESLHEPTTLVEASETEYLPTIEAPGRGREPIFRPEDFDQFKRPSL